MCAAINCLAATEKRLDVEWEIVRQMGQEAQEVKSQLCCSQEKVDNAVMVIHHLITTLNKEVKRCITAEQLASELQEQILEANTKIS